MNVYRLGLIVAMMISSALYGESIAREEKLFTDVAPFLGVDDGGRGRGSTFNDFDNDGDLDLFVANCGDPNVFYRNNGDGTFTNITVSAGLNIRGGSSNPKAHEGNLSYSAVLGDYDNDGDLDLYMTNAWAAGTVPDFLFRNNGDGTFTEVAAQAGVANTGEGISAAWGDYDWDGDVDLFVVNFGQADVLYRNNGDGTFTDVSRDVGITDAFFSLTGSFADYDNDGDLDIFVANYVGRNYLYQNQGDGTFINVAREAGVIWPFTAFSHVFGDIDNDGDLDLYIAAMNIKEDPGKMEKYGAVIPKEFIRKRTSVLPSTASVERGREIYRARCAGCHGEEGYGDGPEAAGLKPKPMDLHGEHLYRITEGGTFWLIGYGMPGQFGHHWSDVLTDEEIWHLVHFLRTFDPGEKCILYRNNGDGTFTDVTMEAGVGYIGGPMGLNAFDYDYDGNLDLALGCGGPHAGRMEFEVLYRNNGDGTFTDVAYEVGFGDERAGHGISVGDYDGNGYLDVYLPYGQHILPLGQPNALYANKGTGNHWITLHLVGAQSKKFAFDAKVIVTSGDLTRIDAVNGGTGFCSQNSLPLEFGLKDRTRVDRVEIRWPSGIVQVLEDIEEVDRTITVHEPELGHDLMVQQVLQPPRSGKLVSDVLIPMARIVNVGRAPESDATVACRILTSFGEEVYHQIRPLQRLASYDSVEIAFPAWHPENGDDYVVQCTALLPTDENRGNDTRRVRALVKAFKDIADAARVGDGMPGKGVCITDYDGDGYLDIYVANFGMNFLYRNLDGTTFAEVSREAGVADLGHAISAVWGDIDHDGDDDLYVANTKEPGVLYENVGDGSFKNITAASGIGYTGEAEVSKAILADYDNDGDLDLYVTYAGIANVLYRNRGDGTFEDVTSSAGVGGDGLTKAAAFGDYDNDGDLDLYVANFGPNVLYRNDGDGTFTDITSAAGVLSGGHSFSTAFGDYDNDGDVDLFVGNYAQPDHLYRNNGDGTFDDVADDAGVGGGDGSSLSAVFGDYDSDGYIDLYVTHFGTNVFYRNRGDGTFVDMAYSMGVENPVPSFDAQFGDLNRDGSLDLYVVNLFEKNALYLNTLSSNYWLIVKLIGRESNTNGIGARVVATSGGLIQTRQVSTSQLIFFGIGKRRRVDVLKILWPSGITQAFTNITPNRAIQVIEGEEPFSLLYVGARAVQETAGEGVPKGYILEQNAPNPFNARTTLTFQIPAPGPTELTVYNILGQPVRTLIHDIRAPGVYGMIWDGRDENGRDVATGLYFYALKAGTFRSTKKMLLLR